jgi:signal transduction histidine kinase
MSLLRVMTMKSETDLDAATFQAATPRAENEVGQSELHSITVNDVVRDWDVPAGELRWNVWLERTFGYPVPTGEAATLDWWLERVHADDQISVRALVGAVLEGDATSWSMIYRFRRADDTYANILDRSCVVRGECGRAVRVIGSMLDVTQIRRAQNAADELNRELELRVGDRTRELAVVVRELESFAYSVSHDLRTPLRALNGFSQALLEDHASQLDDTGLDYLQRISAASQRMSVLIDDMLRLSRVSRADMQMQPLDLSDIARDVVAELQAGDAGRCVTFVVSASAPGIGDPPLLRVALFNLLENACKFTRHSESPRVEFGSVEQDGRLSYFVADNGAGFDMAHAGRLFGAFQRLHRSDEYEGTGVGLATVQRIVRRHGGGIRAEAASGSGATFCFTLSGGEFA